MMRLTEKRLAWLCQLQAEGHAARARGRTGFDCMQAGWTEWNYVAEKRISAEEAREKFGAEWWGRVTLQGERLTDKGREIAIHGIVGNDY